MRPGAPGAPPLFGTPRAALTEASEQNLAALRRSMARAKTLSLLFVIADGPARAEVGRRLHAWSGKDGVPALRFFADGEAGLTEIEAFLAEPREEPLQGAVMLDGDVLVARETPVLALNMARDRLGRLIAGPLVLVLAPHGEAEFSRMAPDLFDVRSASYEVEGEPGAAEESLLSMSAPVGLEAARGGPAHRAPLTAEKLRALEASPEAPPLSALADAWLALTSELMVQGRWTDVLDAAQEALRLAGPIGYRAGAQAALHLKARVLHWTGRTAEAEQSLLEALQLAEDKQERARTQSRMATLLWRTGRAEEALRILREEVLPFHATSEDPEEYLNALLDISTVLAKLGRYDEALRTLKEEVLPLSRQIEAPLLRANAMAKIAQIEAAQGRVDIAIDVLRGEAIPLFEQAGNKELLAVCQAQLANDLGMRNGPGDHDEARRLHRLALQNIADSVLPSASGFREAIEDALHNLTPGRS